MTEPSAPMPYAAEPSAETKSESFVAAIARDVAPTQVDANDAALFVFAEYGAGAVVEAEQAGEHRRLLRRGPHEGVDARERIRARDSTTPRKAKNELIRSVRAGADRGALRAPGGGTTIPATARCNEYERQRQRRRSHEGETTRSERRIQRELPESVSSGRILRNRVVPLQDHVVEEIHAKPEAVAREQRAHVRGIVLAVCA